MGFKIRLAGIGIAAAASALLVLVSAPVSAQAVDDPFLTVHGPNDGEPLNKWIEVEARSNAKESGYVLVYHGNKLVSMVPMVAAVGVETRTAAISIDTTRFPNGRVTFSFLLFNEPLDRVLARAHWGGTIANPTMDLGDQRTGGNLAVTLHGVAGDFGYVLLASQDGPSLTQPPMEQPASGKVQWIATGFFPNADLKGIPSTKLVLNVDDLVRVHTTKGSIVLWTLNQKGKWYRSKVIPLRYLLSIPPSYGDRVDPLSRNAYRP